VITPEGHTLPPHNLCQMAHDAGAPYVRRVIGQGDFSDLLQEALEVEGFALVEVLELCPGHGAKRNPGLRLRELAKTAGYEPDVWLGELRASFRLTRRDGLSSLLEESVQDDTVRSRLQCRMALLVGGSAGEGVQRAAEFLVQAAILSGLHVTKKGSFPVTVGVGFSSAEIVLSPDPIEYHGVSRLDGAVISSLDGLNQNRTRIEAMDGGDVWLDESLPLPETKARVRRVDLRGRAGERSAALYGLVLLARETGLIEPETLVRVVRASPLGERIPTAVLEDVLSETE